MRLHPSTLVALLASTLVTLGVASGCPGASGSPGGPGGDDTPDGGGGGGGIVDVGCDRDEACDAGEICDLESGDCVAGLSCEGNETLCLFCGDPDTDCGFGAAPAYCDEGTCRRRGPACAPCDDDNQCAPSSTGLAGVCNDGACAPGCGACPAGFQCEEGGCVPKAAAGSCDTALRCDDGSTCPDGQTCSALGVCLFLCQTDVDCAQGQICILDDPARQNTCAPACTLGDRRIENGVEKVCHADGRFGDACPTPGQTTGCPTGTECADLGVCERTGCLTDQDCPLARTFCDVAGAICVDGCNSDDDCGAFERCEDSQCRPQGCISTDSSCDIGQWCCGNDFHEDPSTCPAGIQDGACFLAPDPWCRPCEDNDDCSDINSFGFVSLCFELTQQDQAGNDVSLGKFCSVGCNGNSDCPRGLQCAEGLPDGNDGETNGCLGTLCPALAGARQ